MMLTINFYVFRTAENFCQSKKLAKLMDAMAIVLTRRSHGESLSKLPTLVSYIVSYKEKFKAVISPF